MSKHILSLIALAVVMVIHYLLALWLVNMRVAVSRTFNVRVMLWVFALLDMVFALTVLGLFWLVNVWQDRSVAVSLVYIMVGLGLLLAIPLMNTLPGPRFLRGIVHSNVFFTGHGGLPLVGAFLMLIGLYPFVFRRGKTSLGAAR